MDSYLYERLGDKDAIAAVVADFRARSVADDRMKDDIVEVQSQETGTPLPDAYKPAPALS